MLNSSSETCTVKLGVDRMYSHMVLLTGVTHCHVTVTQAEQWRNSHKLTEFVEFQFAPVNEVCKAVNPAA